MCHAQLTLQKKTIKNIENAHEYVEAKSVKGETYTETEGETNARQERTKRRNEKQKQRKEAKVRKGAK